MKASEVLVAILSRGPIRRALDTLIEQVNWVPCFLAGLIGTPRSMNNKNLPFLAH